MHIYTIKNWEIRIKYQENAYRKTLKITGYAYHFQVLRTVCLDSGNMNLVLHTKMCCLLDALDFSFFGGCWKLNPVSSEQKNRILYYFSVKYPKAESQEKIIQFILNDILKDSCIYSQLMIAKVVDEIVDFTPGKIFKRKHSGECVGQKKI